MRCLHPYSGAPLLGVRPALEDADVGDKADRVVGGPPVPGLLEAVVEEPGNGIAVLDRDMNEQLVVETQHDPCG
jgi:hypothetical protein